MNHEIACYKPAICTLFASCAPLFLKFFLSFFAILKCSCSCQFQGWDAEQRHITLNLARQSFVRRMACGSPLPSNSLQLSFEPRSFLAMPERLGTELAYAPLLLKPLNQYKHCYKLRDVMNTVFCCSLQSFWVRRRKKKNSFAIPFHPALCFPGNRVSDSMLLIILSL